MDNFEEKLSAVLNDPETMSKVASIARSLGGGEGRPEDASSGPEAQTNPAALLGALSGSSDDGPSIDPAMLGKLMQLWSAYKQGSDPQKVAVLNAVKPYLHPDRQERVDRALQTLRLAHVAREALGDDFLGTLFGKR